MNKKIENILNKAKDVTLSNEEKTSILQSVKSFMEKNPISNTNNSPQVSPYVRYGDVIRHNIYKSVQALNLKNNKIYTMPLILLLLLAGIGGGTSLAANSALPGDALYPVKVHVNENIESALAVSPQSNAEVAAKHALTRLTEANQLAEEGKLTEELNTEIKNNFGQTVSTLAKQLGEMKNSGATTTVKTISSNFQKELDIHNRGLASLARTATSTNPVLEDLIKSLNGENDENTSTNTNNQTSTTNTNTNTSTSTTTSTTDVKTSTSTATSTNVTSTTTVNTNTIPLSTALKDINRFANDEDSEGNDEGTEGNVGKDDSYKSTNTATNTIQSLNSNNTNNNHSENSSESEGKQGSEAGKSSNQNSHEREND